MADINFDEKATLEYALDRRSQDGPSWRWNLAGEEIHGRPGSCLRRFGQSVLDVHHYRTLSDHSPIGRKQALALYPSIAAAEDLNGDVAKTGLIKVGVLGELPLDEISRQLKVDVTVLKMWEMMFYDIRGLRSASAWINTHVILPELEAGRADLAARLRFVSAVGTRAAEAILKADTRLPIAEGQRLFERQLKLHLKFEAAAEMTPNDNRSRLFFMRQHGMLIFEKKRLEFAREKLGKKCVEALDRHKLAMIRAEITLERERNRAAVIARRAEGIALAKRGDEESRKLLAVRRREQKLAEQAAMAARIAASPLSRRRWRHRGESRNEAPSLPATRPVQDGTPHVIAQASVPLAVVLPKGVRMPLTGVLV
jgi:hypothetical protein